MSRGINVHKIACYTMNIRLYLGAVTFPLQVKLWVHTVQMLAKTRVVTNGQINFRLFN